MGIECIIPAYNEEKTIGNVIKAVKESNMIDNIVVVSDGSNDGTAAAARSLGVCVIEYSENRGKGAAIKIGVENTSSDILLLLDADLIGLTRKHVVDLLMPILKEEADMTVGVFSNGRFSTDLAQRIAPNLSGQRAVRRNIIDSINNLDIMRYGVEVALTQFANKKGYRVKTVELKDMTHIMKEEKLGFRKGFKLRMKMYWDIIKCLKPYEH